MRIAFDLDDTLIPGQIPFELEPLPRNWLRRVFCAERLRLGTAGLINDLWRRGHDVWIYTTSFRSPLAVHLLFRGYGTRVGRVINETSHRQRIARLGEHFKLCTKLPPAFGIDLLIDDCEGVYSESQRYNFAMLRIAPDDPGWLTVVRQHVGLVD